MKSILTIIALSLCLLGCATNDTEVRLQLLEGRMSAAERTLERLSANDFHRRRITLAHQTLNVPIGERLTKDRMIELMKRPDFNEKHLDAIMTLLSED